VSVAVFSENHDTGPSRPQDARDFVDERDELVAIIRLLDAEIARLKVELGQSTKS
jgi:uncharacterized small protein (DUF1192 family)